MKLTTFKPSRLAALLCVGAMGFAVQAHALTFTPSTLPQWTGTGNNALFANDVEDLITGYTGELASVYKQDYNGSEVGNAAPYYTTSFTMDDQSPPEPVGGSITWQGGLWIDCPDCFLVVKDGNANPSTYIFNLGNWDGQEMITLTGFWEGTQGAISYVEIFTSTYEDGGPPSMVPEAETYAMMLAGLGLVGFAARRKRAKAA